VSVDLAGICARRAELLRELAELEAAIPAALAGLTAAKGPSADPDEVLDAKAAAVVVGRSLDWFGRHRAEYVSALVSRKGQRPRYSRRLLERCLTRANRSRTRTD
jgi:hypothetical protein